MPWVDIPETRIFHWAVTTLSSQTVDASTRRAVIGVAPRSGNIRGVAFRIATANTEVNAQVGLYTLDSSGLPTSTNFRGSQDSALFAPNPASIREVIFPSPATGVVAGEPFAVVFRWNGTTGSYGLMGSGDRNMPYGAVLNGATWTRNTISVSVAMLYENDTNYYRFGQPLGSTSSTSYNNTSSPNVRGNLFQLPFGVRFQQVEFYVGTSGPYRVSVLDGADTEVAYAERSASFDGNVEWYPQLVYLNQTVEFMPNTPFRIVITPLSSTNVTAFRGYNLMDNAARVTWGIRHATLVRMTTRTGAGAWSNIDTQVHWIQPVFSSIFLPETSAAYSPFPPHIIVT